MLRTIKVLMVVSVCMTQNCFAQKHFSRLLDEKEDPIKIEHAEPLFIDLIRDLGARRGEREWNVGLGLTDQHSKDEYSMLIEYEWAPINRLGLEVELPFSFYSGTSESNVEESHRLNCFKTAAQYTFLVQPIWRTSLALGYINELELTDFKSFSNPRFIGNTFNPFLVGAKRWGQQWHSLIYTGPSFQRHFEHASWNRSYEVNSSLHYLIPTTRNFVGLEMNTVFFDQKQHVVLRPQMRLAVVDNVMVGILAGIPTAKKMERFSAFMRLIWEPKHH